LPRDLVDKPLMALFIRDTDIADNVRSISRLFIARLICGREDLHGTESSAMLEREVQELLRYSNDVFSRFERNPDTLDRILKTDVVVSYSKFGRFFVDELLQLPKSGAERFESVWNRWFSPGWLASVKPQLQTFKRHFDRVSSEFLNT
jgi:hypothetical protein